MSDQSERAGHHRQEQASRPRAAAAAAPWPETEALPPSHNDSLVGRLWAFGEFPTDEERTAGDLAVGITNVGFIRAALRRSRWLWLTTAALGLIIGLAAFKEFPPSYQASATILLGNNPFEQIGSAVQDDQAIVQSRAVAGAALRKLGLHESPGLFVGDYTAAIVTNRVLAVTVKASSYPEAMREANALAAAFLANQKHQLLAQQALNEASLQQAVNQAMKYAASITARIKSVSAQPPSRAKRAELSSLLVQRSEATADLVVLQQSKRANDASTKINTATLINGSQVLDPAAPLPQHAKKYMLLYVGGGLIGGLMLGLFIVVVRALVSDKLRRRDDVARALGAPVKLSVGKIGQSHWRPGPRGLAAAKDTSIQRIVVHLGSAVSTGSPRVAALAVVPVDEPQVAALAIASLALSCAQEGFHVVLADLCHGSPAGQLLGVTDPGIQPVHNDGGANLLLAIPDRDDVELAGPLRNQSSRNGATEPLAAACESADILLTLASLDPSVGGEFLGGWARSAVAVVTAGQSSAERIHAAGEMIRLAGVDLISAVLVGADKTDESLGVIDRPSLPTSVGHSVHR